MSTTTENNIQRIDAVSTRNSFYVNWKKTFTDDEYIKQAMCYIMNDILSKNSLIEMSNISKKLLICCIIRYQKIYKFIQCLDESTDMTGSPELAIFIKGKNNNFKVSEE